MAIASERACCADVHKDQEKHKFQIAAKLVLQVTSMLVQSLQHVPGNAPQETCLVTQSCFYGSKCCAQSIAAAAAADDAADRFDTRWPL